MSGKKMSTLRKINLTRKLFMQSKKWGKIHRAKYKKLGALLLLALAKQTCFARQLVCAKKVAQETLQTLLS